eukprot:TRINITY_DN7568_c0_g2_i1.p1 TRINITY_DN7568_c0_g2~~TRINITY_DN7568_c0_g2_i1.p1  ORF type:complete len:391 (+),score=35.16 TRINITY_DN7568_c0_g2_i1:920-2092(+)
MCAPATLADVTVYMTKYDMLGEVNEGAKNLTELLVNVPFLSRLFMILNVEDFDDQGSSAVARLLQKCRTLSQLKLRFDRSSATDTTLLLLVGVLPGLSYLKEVELSFSGVESQIKDHGTIALLQSLRSLRQLRMLSINLSNCFSLTDATGIEISLLLNHLQGLSSLRLYIEQVELKEATLLQLSKSLSGLKQLKDFLLNLNKFSISSSLINFRAIDLSEDIYCCFIQDLSSASLSEITLCFADSPDFGNRAAKCFADLLRSQPLLEKICLLIRQTAVTDEGLIEIASGLSNVPKLKDLHLSLGGLKISDESVKRLNQSLLTLENLYSMNLDISFCKDVTDQAGATFAELLRVRTNINKVSLSYLGTSIRNQARDNLRKVSTERHFEEFRI